MQAESGAQPNSRPNTRHQTADDRRLRETTALDLTAHKRRLVEVPYTASLAHTVNALVANGVTAVPVAAPPGHWIGAGGSMIVESDKFTRAVRKHYIGMVTMLDILNHIAEGIETDGGIGSGTDLDAWMSVQVSSVIGNCLEGLSLWTLNPNTSILDCMEVFSKAIHRALVPVDSHMENVAGVELEEYASSYRMLTQMDVLRFLKENANELEGTVSRNVKELGAVMEDVFAVTHDVKVTEALKCMRAGSLNAVPIVENLSALQVDQNQRLIMLVATFSATVLREWPVSELQSWMHLSIVDFIQKVRTRPSHAASGFESHPLRTTELVTCHAQSPLAAVIDKAVSRHVHRVWVVDGLGLPVGLVSLTDIIRVIRASLLTDTSSHLILKTTELGSGHTSDS